jgi:hypothetical protein
MRFVGLLGLLGLLGLVTTLGACTYAIAKFGIVSPKEVRPSQLVGAKVTRDMMTGDDSITYILLIPLKWRPYDMRVAMQRALDKVPGGIAIQDCTISETKVIVPILYHYLAYHVEGKVLVDPILREKELAKRRREAGRGASGR